MKKVSEKTIVRIVIAALSIILLLIAGYNIVKKNKVPQSKIVTSNTNGKQIIEPATIASQNSQSSDNLQALLQEMPTSSTSDQESIDNYSKKINEQSVDTKIVTFSDCKADPVVTRITLPATITIKNNDSAAHTISHPKGINIIVPANSQVNYTFTVAQGGIYGYTCDSKTAGLFFIIDSQHK